MIVLFSDIHGNVVTLEAVLAAIRREAAPDALFIAGEHRRVPYDIQAVARDYTAVGFPNASQAAEQLLNARGFSAA